MENTMKVLINANFEALRKGDFVEANEDAGEFILVIDEEDATCNVSNATLIEICKSSNLNVRKQKTSKLTVKSVLEAFLLKQLPEVNRMSDSSLVKEIVQRVHGEGGTEEQMMIEAMNKGVKFKAAANLVDKLMQEFGYRVSTKKRKEQGRKILVDAEFMPKDYSDVEEMCDTLCKQIADTVTSQAFAIIRAYCKEFQLEMPKPAKKPKGGFNKILENWMIQNIYASDDMLIEQIRRVKNEPGESLIKRTQDKFAFAKQCADAGRKAVN